MGNDHDVVNEEQKAAEEDVVWENFEKIREILTEPIFCPGMAASVGGAAAQKHIRRFKHEQKVAQVHW